jgi:high-affinity Fe2+/Pb2+ permease
MQSFLKILSYLGLALTVVPSFLVFSGVIDLSYHKMLMLIGTLLWFLTAPFWMNKQKHQATPA